MVVAYKLPDDKVRVVLKGAPEVIIPLCTSQLDKKFQQVKFEQSEQDAHLKEVSNVISRDKDILKAISYAYCDWNKDKFDRTYYSFENHETEEYR